MPEQVCHLIVRKTQIRVNLQPLTAQTIFLSDRSRVQINRVRRWIILLISPTEERVLFLPAGAAFLHHLCSVVPGQLAETIVAVDDGPVHNLGVSQDKVGICLDGNKKKKERKKKNSQIKQLYGLDSTQKTLKHHLA